ncbi:MAG: 4Fe-4S binding protein [Sneathiella sp.]|nr:4Fe-4S binding protein [Sneathiella sp.]
MNQIVPPPVIADLQPKSRRVNKRHHVAAAGDWLRRHQRAIRWLQWHVVVIYAVLLIVPVLVPLPVDSARIWNNVSLFARFVFWGIWWPGVLISMLLFGRLWCGIMCPEGALSEMASRHGRGRAIPRWIRWPGWPFTAFVLTTVYGQMVSVYQYPGPVLIVLGGSTLAAILVGYLYGRNHRVWCRYLCPVNGVFGLLAKLAPLHYQVDRQQWEHRPPHIGRVTRINCAPMVPLRTMESASPCHMCGRCAGFRDSIELSARPPGSEIIAVSARTATVWDSLLIVVGLMGVTVGAFLWASSPWFIAAKQWAAGRLVGLGVFWPLEQDLPWWLLTNYPGNKDVMSLLDGTVLIGYIGMITAVMTMAVGMPFAVAARILGPSWHGQRFHHLVHSLLPLAACGIILGLSAQSVTLLRGDGFPLNWVDDARIAALACSSAWSLYLTWRIAGRYRSGVRRAVATGFVLAGIVAGVLPWIMLFFVW